jgi:Zn finger protein HypA/HybF involved in hydrogenase expression
VINSYRTNSSVLVNESEIETFIQNTLPNIQEFIQKMSTLLDEVNSSMAKTMAKRINFNNMRTEIDESDSPENAICIQTNIETNDMNGQCHNGQTESTNDKEDNLVYRCPICRKRPSPVMNVMNGITTAVLSYHN